MQCGYTTYINNSRPHRWLRSCAPRLGENQSTPGKPICPIWWPHDHINLYTPFQFTSKKCRKQLVV